MLILTTREHFPQFLVKFNIKTKTILLILKFMITAFLQGSGFTLKNLNSEINA